MHPNKLLLLLALGATACPATGGDTDEPATDSATTRGSGSDSGMSAGGTQGTTNGTTVGTEPESSVSDTSGGPGTTAGSNTTSASTGSDGTSTTGVSATGTNADTGTSDPLATGTQTSDSTSATGTGGETDTGGGETDSSGGETGTSGGETDTGGGETDTGGGDSPFFPPCDALEVSEPITLEDFTPPTSRKTPAALAWDGSDLVVVRDDREDGGNACEIVFERRDVKGELMYTHRFPSNGICQWNSSLGYHAGSDTFLYTHQYPQQARAVALDSNGEQLWQTGLWDVCNSITTTIDVATRADEWVVMGEEYNCGSDPRSSAARVFDLDGNPVHTLKTLKATGSTGDAACDLPTCDRLLTIRYGLLNAQSGVYVRMGDLDQGTLDAQETKIGGSAYGGWHASAAAFNGQDWLLVRIEKTQGNVIARIRLWDENQGWSGSAYNLNVKKPMEIELLWTGSDYVMAVDEWPYESGGLPSDWTETDVRLALLGPDGAVKQSFLLEDNLGFAGYGPQIVMLPGKIALTWIRINGFVQSRHLAFIECAS